MSLIELLHSAGGMLQYQNRIYGVVTGIVVDNRDPAHQGRVKVNFPWLAEEGDAVALTTSADERRAHSYWARMATLMAGKGRGSWFIPEKDDEVLVAFEHGMLDRPFVVGILWNYDDTPPEKNGNGKNDIRAIHSRSGHRIVLNDSDDTPSILVVDKTGDNSILIDSANNAMEIKVKGDLTIEAEGNISITARGKLDIEADQDFTAQTKTNLSLKATGNGELQSTGPLNIQSQARMTVDGTAQAEVKAAAVSVNGSGITEIKGGLVKIN
ncbi:MAG: phage tail protein [Anaerolineae bacterium]|nr:phage tail protein [Anaerolineae bacterium]